MTTDELRTLIADAESVVVRLQQLLASGSGRYMPRQKPGRSKQNYGTPPDFLKAVYGYLGIDRFGLDLAAEEGNRVAARYFTEANDSLTLDWEALMGYDEWAWLNPPFKNIAKWVEKCAHQSAAGCHIAVLIPASIGSNYWRDWVEPYAKIVPLNGRITFLGCTDPYPKDCALLIYAPGIEPGYQKAWSWQK